MQWTDEARALKIFTNSLPALNLSSECVGDMHIALPAGPAGRQASFCTGLYGISPKKTGFGVRVEISTIRSDNSIRRDVLLGSFACCRILVTTQPSWSFLPHTRRSCRKFVPLDRLRGRMDPPFLGPTKLLDVSIGDEDEHALFTNRSCYKGLYGCSFFLSAKVAL